MKIYALMVTAILLTFILLIATMKPLDQGYNYEFQGESLYIAIPPSDSISAGFIKEYGIHMYDTPLGAAIAPAIERAAIKDEVRYISGSDSIWVRSGYHQFTFEEFRDLSARAFGRDADPRYLMTMLLEYELARMEVGDLLPEPPIDRFKTIIVPKAPLEAQAVVGSIEISVHNVVVDYWSDGV